jgi:mono/diheme cytochrome c family protein
VRLVAPLVVALLGIAASACERETSAATDPDTSAERRRGHDLFFGRAGCYACHKVGVEGTQIRGPNLGTGDDQTEPIAARARLRRPDLVPAEYVVESILAPDAVVAPGYAPGIMQRPDQPPLSLTDDEAIALAAYLVDAPAPDLQAARRKIVEIRAARERR